MGKGRAVPERVGMLLHQVKVCVVAKGIERMRAARGDFRVAPTHHPRVSSTGSWRRLLLDESGLRQQEAMFGRRRRKPSDESAFHFQIEQDAPKDLGIQFHKAAQ